MLRTVCLGSTASVVSTCTSSTAPVGLATIRTDNTLGSVAISSSARRMGSTLPAIAPPGADGGIKPKFTGMDRGRSSATIR